MLRPIASRSLYPKRLSAAEFHDVTLSSRSIVTIAVGLSSSSDSRYCLRRWSSRTSW